MRLPHSVQIKGKRYRITRLKDESYHGEYCKDESYIAINMSDPSHEKAATLLHEVLHGIIAEYKIFVRKEEQLVSGLEKGIVEFIKKNPGAIKYILRHIGSDDES